MAIVLEPGNGMLEASDAAEPFEPFEDAGLAELDEGELFADESVVDVD